MLKANATKPVILVTHSYMYTDNTTVDQCDTADNTTKTQTNGVDGQRMWRTFVSQYPNIKMVLSGHVLGVGEVVVKPPRPERDLADLRRRGHHEQVAVVVTGIVGRLDDEVVAAIDDPSARRRERELGRQRETADPH